MIKEQVKKIPNWKILGPDGVQSYWLKKLTALHERIAKQMDNIISNRDDLPKVLTIFLILNDKLPVEQKGCKKESRGIKDQLLIDKTIMRDCRKRHASLGMAWIDYKKAYDMVLHSWKLETLELVQVSDNILEFVERSVAN